MKPSYQPIFSTHLSLHDVAQAADAIADWDVEFCQLSEGSLNTQLTVIASENITIQKVQFDKPVHQQGASPKGTHTFGFLQYGSDDIKWGAEAGRSDDLMLFSSKGWDVISQPGFIGHTLSFSEATIDRINQCLGYEVSVLNNAPSSLVKNGMKTMSNIPFQVKQLLRHIEIGGALPAQEAFNHFLNFELPTMLLNSSYQQPFPVTTKPKNRERIRKKALDIISSSEANTLTIPFLCQEVGTSLSTIERVFRSYFGVGPKQYINIVRLHRLHKALWLAQPNEHIINIASRFGFWHMGQLAQDYYKLFNCLPSKTLKSKFIC